LHTVEGHQDAAGLVEALGDFAAQRPRHQRLRVFEEDIVDVIALLAADFQGVAKPLRGDQAGFGALALDDGVGDQRGAVDGGGNRRWIQVSLSE
jgi:hypothetical protein